MLGIGVVKFRGTRPNMAKWIVTSREDIISIIFPLFDIMPCLTAARHWQIERARTVLREQIIFHEYLPELIFQPRGLDITQLVT